jgi:hypothetical protein
MIRGALLKQEKTNQVRDILAVVMRLDFLGGVWAFAGALALHEVEEWNILRWYQRNYVDLPPVTDEAVRTRIAFISIVGFVWCAVATLPSNRVVAAFAILPAAFLAVQNAPQHVYWLFYFRQYALGVVTSLLFLLPLAGI